MKNRFIIFIVTLFIGVSCAYSQVDLSKYVDPYIGVEGGGNVFPGPCVPFGMVKLGPDCGNKDWNAGWDPTGNIHGFSHTHVSGTGGGCKYGNILMLPMTGEINLDDYSSPRSGEKVLLGEYAVGLSRYNTHARLTALSRSGFHEYTFPEGTDSKIIIDLGSFLQSHEKQMLVGSEVKIVSDTEVEGYSRVRGGWNEGGAYTVYFYAEFSRPFRSHGVWLADIPDNWTRKREDIESKRYQEIVKNAQVIPDVSSFAGKHLGFYADFDTKAGEQILMKSGISFTSLKNAEENLRAEMKAWDFDAILGACQQLWDDALAKISVTGGTEDEKYIFYTALYHTMIDPRVCSDVNGEYMGADKQVHRTGRFSKRTIFSGWDVFRSQMPLQTIINPTLINDQINSLVEIADQSGYEYLERWEFFNAYSGCMLGNPAISVLCDAYSKGIRSYDVEKAYKYALNTSRLFGNNEAGYAPGSISHTLEYAYSDWCMARLAEWLEKEDDKVYFDQRAKSYSTIYNADYGWFLPRNDKGEFHAVPDGGRLAEGHGCTESNAYQQGWFVPHDVDGMVQMMGGREKVLADLTDMFEKTPKSYLWNQYYNHANEPVHHVPFLFNRLDAPELTQKWTRDICRNAYKNSVLGLVGNEDVGQMSAWYVLAASGLHPICPGDQRYEITSPVFEKVVFHLDPDYAEAKTFVIEARDNSPENVYIQQATLNGKPYDKCYLMHADLMRGGTLVLRMGATPSDWGK